MPLLALTLETCIELWMQRRMATEGPDNKLQLNI